MAVRRQKMLSNGQEKWSKRQRNIREFMHMRLRDECAASSAEQKESSFTCPLTHLPAGQVCRVRRLCASAEICQRLREIGLCEDQVVTRLANQTSIICLVCNARLALSAMLAELILVEPLEPHFQPIGVRRA